MTEIWRDIEGYEGLYQVSSEGRVRSLNYRRSGKTVILKIFTNKRGYCHIMLKRKQYQIHRLVALAFVDNPDNLPVVNHKDENPSNNRADNLEWCDQRYNMNYSTSPQRISQKLTKYQTQEERIAAQKEQHRQSYLKNKEHQMESQRLRRRMAREARLLSI